MSARAGEGTGEPPKPSSAGAEPRADGDSAPAVTRAAGTVGSGGGGASSDDPRPQGDPHAHRTDDSDLSGDAAVNPVLSLLRAPHASEELRLTCHACGASVDSQNPPLACSRGNLCLYVTNPRTVGKRAAFGTRCCVNTKFEAFTAFLVHHGAKLYPGERLCPVCARACSCTAPSKEAALVKDNATVTAQRRAKAGLPDFDGLANDSHVAVLGGVWQRIGLVRGEDRSLSLLSTVVLRSKLCYVQLRVADTHACGEARSPVSSGGKRAEGVDPSASGDSERRRVAKVGVERSVLDEAHMYTLLRRAEQQLPALAKGPSLFAQSPTDAKAPWLGTAPSSFFILEELGPSLEDSPAEFDEACKLAVNVLKALFVLHGTGYLHMDVAPDNICRMGGTTAAAATGSGVATDSQAGPGGPAAAAGSGGVGAAAGSGSGGVTAADQGTAILIDFKHCRLFREQRPGGEDGMPHRIPRKHQRVRIGRGLFASVAAHEEAYMEPTDDLESLGYVLAHIAGESSEWSDDAAHLQGMSAVSRWRLKSSVLTAAKAAKVHETVAEVKRKWIRELLSVPSTTGGVLAAHFEDETDSSDEGASLLIRAAADEESGRGRPAGLRSRLREYFKALPTPPSKEHARVAPAGHMLRDGRDSKVYAACCKALGGSDLDAAAFNINPGPDEATRAICSTQ